MSLTTECMHATLLHSIIIQYIFFFIVAVAENNPLVKLKFEHKLLSIDLDRSNLTFRG